MDVLLYSSRKELEERETRIDGLGFRHRATQNLTFKHLIGAGTLEMSSIQSLRVDTHFLEFGFPVYTVICLKAPI